MLCQFTVKNFQCIKDEVTLDLQAASITDNNSSLITDTDGEVFLPVSVIYGPNGGGKSTVLHAIYSLVSKIMRPICAVICDNKECLKISKSSSIKPFAFSKTTINEPTEYEIFFRTQTNEYQYILHVKQNKVIKEELNKKAIDGYRYSPVFKRTGTKDIELHGSFKKYSCSDVSSELPLLSYFGITHKRNSTIKEILTWLEGRLFFANYGNPIEDARIPLIDSPKAKEAMLDMIKEMDIDISDYIIKKEEDKTQVLTLHTVNNKTFQLDLLEESSGTIKLFSIIPYLLDGLKTGGTLIIDELDAKLHPMLLKYIIDLFTNPEINKKHAQLIFTSHDLSTMNSETFRRDEIWFIAKGDDLSSKMYSLVEFKRDDGSTERKDAKFSKRYLEGRYGADPYLKRIINWEEF